MERRTAVLDLTTEQLARALQSVIPGATLTSHELAASGRANTNYFLATDRGRFVLRLHVRGSNLAEKERAVVQFVADKVPTAALLGHGETSQGVAFTLLSFVEGDTLERVLRQGDQARIELVARELGRTLARLASYRFDHGGDLIVRAGGALEVAPWPFSNFFQWALFESPAGPRLGSMRDRLWDFLESARDRYPDPWHTHLVHGDFNPTNLLVAKTGKLAAVLDWEFAHAGQIWMDLGNLLRHRPALSLPESFAAQLLEGLRDGGVSLPTHWRALSTIVDLSSACDFLSSAEERPQTHAQALRQIRNTLTELGADP